MLETKTLFRRQNQKRILKKKLTAMLFVSFVMKIFVLHAKARRNV
jgi:hypothetical protein